MPDEKKDDVVKTEEYNKVVEEHNSVKVEKEKLENEVKEMKEAQEKAASEQKDKGLEDQKAAWEKEKVDMQKQIDDAKAKAESEDNKVAKGVISENKVPNETAITPEKTIEEINRLIPDREKDPEKFGSNLQRYGYYKSPSTRQYNDEQLGMALDLSRGAQESGQMGTSNYANKSKEDIILN